MERIEQIKERMNNLNIHYVDSSEIIEDIDFLFSLIETQKKEIERYEKVLAKIEHRSVAYTDYEPLKVVLNDIREMSVLARKK